MDLRTISFAGERQICCSGKLFDGGSRYDGAYIGAVCRIDVCIYNTGMCLKFYIYVIRQERFKSCYTTREKRAITQNYTDEDDLKYMRFFGVISPTY